jgi:hypothetical protein
MEQLCPLCDAAIDKYRSLIEAAARKIVIGASGVPQLAEYIHQGTEDMIVNTLLFTPVVTFAYLLLSSFLGVGGKGKKRKNRKQPHLASPGKPAFKPSGSPSLDQHLQRTRGSEVTNKYLLFFSFHSFHLLIQN